MAHEPVLTLVSHDIRVTVSLNQDAEDPEMRSKLSTIFSAIGKILLPRTIKYKNQQEIPGANAFDKVQYLAENDNSLLNCCMTAMIIQEGQERDNLDIKQKIQIFTACENLRGILEHRASAFRHLFARCVAIMGETHLYKLLQWVGLSYSKTTETKRDRQRANHMEFELSRLQLNKHSYAILLFDNLGFKNRQGYRKGLGYEQFTVLKIVIISHNELKRIKVYGENELDRVDKDWEAIRGTAEGTFEKVLAPTTEDLNMLGTNTMTIMHSILEYEARGGFPSTQEIKDMLKNESLLGSAPEVFPCPAYAGRNQTAIDDGDLNLDADAEGTDNGTEIGVSRGHDRIIYDVPMKRDLANKDTVEDLLKYGLEIKKGILDSNMVDPEFTNYTPVLDDLKFAYAGDGSPIIAAHGINRQNDNLKSQCLAVFGGFHLMLEMYKKIGSVFQHTHLRAINSLFRFSTAAQDFVLNPSDPNQAEGEMFQRHLAFVLSALRALLHQKSKHKWKWNMDSDSSSDDESADDATELDVVEVCVAELLDFMTIRAAENTQAFVILMEMRFSEIIFLLQRSEYAANADMYCTGMKYALLLAVNSNAYKYVEMICNFFVERTCMSDCQRKVLDEFVMFRRTKYEKYIYSDRSVEWVMRDIRQYLGKYFKQSTTDQLRRLLMQMHEVKDLKNTSSGSNTIMSLGGKCRIKID